jgi:hypothetical protein
VQQGDHPPHTQDHPVFLPSVGEPVQCVFVSGNETATCNDKERRLRWQKAHEGVLYPGVVSDINHCKQIVTVDFDDGDKVIDVPFKLVKLQDGQFCDETLSMTKRRSTTKRRTLTPSKADYKWCHTGVHRMRFVETTYDGQPFPERMILSNTYELLINGKWEKQPDLEHVSMKDTINHPDLADVYTTSIWEFTQEMYYKKPKKEVLHKQIKKRQDEIEKC